MARGERTVKIKFDGDTRGLGQAASRGRRAMDRFKRGMAVAAKAAGAALLAVAAGAAVFAKTALDAGREGLAVEKRLNQVFKSMGGLGSKTFQDLARQTDVLGKKLAQPGTEIQKIQTKLATFGPAWKHGTEGAKNFQRATELAFDLEAAGFGEANSNITQLGKALADPVKGITALARAGVTFTEAEKEKIKKLVESGKLLQAQEIILKSLEEQVGGTAAAGVDGLDRWKKKWEDFKDFAGRKILTGLEKLIIWIEETAIPAVKKFIDKIRPWLEKGKKLLQDLFGDDVKSGFQDLKAAWDDVREVLKDPDVQIALKTLAVLFGVTLLVAIKFVVAQFRLAAFILKIFLAPAIKFFAVITKTQLNIVLAAVEAFLRALKFVIDIAAKIPGPHQKAMRSVSKSIDGAIGKVKGLRDAINNIPTAKKVDIRFTNRKQFLAHIRQMRRELRSLTNQGVRVAGVTGQGGFAERAHGGPVRAGRSYLVGEQGPELLTMTGRGSGFVTPADETREVLSGGGDTTVQVFLDGRLLEPVAVKVFRAERRALKRRTVAGTGRAA